MVSDEHYCIGQTWLYEGFSLVSMGKVGASQVIYLETVSRRRRADGVFDGTICSIKSWYLYYFYFLDN